MHNYGNWVEHDSERMKQVRSHPWILCWLEIGKEIWITLSLGWCWLFVSFFLSYQVPSSGAVLVCCAIVSDLFFARKRFRTYPRSEVGNLIGFGLVETTQGKYALFYKGLFIIGETDGFRESIRALLGLSKDDEWTKYSYIDTRLVEGTFWICGFTIDRVEKVISTSIIISAVFGTLIWGYSNCLYEQCDAPI